VKAAQIHAYGDAETLRVEDVDPPAVGPRDVLIEVVAASVNPIDWKIRSGHQRAIIRYRLPHVLGLDVSGVVVEVGKRVRRFRVGDEVFSSPSHRRQGTYAEYAAIDERAVALKPSNITHEEAAGIPLAGLTAWQALEGRVAAGDKVLVQAGAGGVGSLAIQIAKHFGATVATTCSARNVELCTQLGADMVIDYGREAFDDVLSDYDLVFDTLGGEHKVRARDVLRRGGRLVSIVNDIPGAVKKHGPYLGMASAMGALLAFKLGCMWRGIRFSYVLRKPDGDALAALGTLIESGAVKPLNDSVYPLEEIVAAHQASESGRARGKIIIAVRDR
jgi:NADPH:quinone reductase-like Zn-dependent oxidoreductase